MPLENITAAFVVRKVLKDVRPLFYLESPSTSSFQHLSDVPNYIKQVTPYFFAMIFVEVLVRWLQGKPRVRLNDSINSLSAGVILILTKMIFGSIELSAYIWVYSHWCVLELPWDSAWTWTLAFLGVDCTYYWFHRMAHEVNLFWAAHQVHHSSEDYTLSTALRQSAFQRFSSWFMYLPMALMVPPSAYFAHKQLNLLYQFWIHTEIIDRMGPLEWVLNTPSHHRVHHGRNPYCIDCNYAGVLIIWDRMFGTFQPELREEKVIYGLVHPLGSWDPFWAQVQHYVYLAQTVWGNKMGWRHNLQFLFKGPGWSPGKPRLGYREDIPQVSPDEKPYDTNVPLWLNFYIVIHFAYVVIFAHKMQDFQTLLHPLVSLAFILYLIFSLSSFGLLFEGNPICLRLELVRLAVLLFADMIISSSAVSVLSYPTLIVFRVLVPLSLALWMVKYVNFITGKKAKSD